MNISKIFIRGGLSISLISMLIGLLSPNISCSAQSSHTYDNLNRLVQTIYTEGAQVTTVTYTYDNVGNMTNFNVTSNTTPGPAATTGSASSVTPTSATLNGTVNPNGASTTVVFDYGLTASYGKTVTTTQSPLSGSTNQAVSKGITGLSTGKTYHFRVKATNVAGTTLGSDKTFYTSYSSIAYVNKDDPTCDGNTPCYTSIQTAINEVADGTAIRIARGTYTESISLNASKTIALQGGWNDTFDEQTANSTFILAPKAPKGALKLQMLTIKP